MILAALGTSQGMQMVQYIIRDNRNEGTRRRPRYDRLQGTAFNLRGALEAVAQLNEREADKERFELDSWEPVEVVRGGRVIETPTAWMHLMK